MHPDARDAREWDRLTPEVRDEPPTFLHSDREPVASFGDDPFEGLDLDSAHAELEDIERG